MNIEKCLEKYSTGFFRAIYGNELESEEESYRKGKDFLQKYALDNDTFLMECVPTMRKIFRYGEKQELDLRQQLVTQFFHNEYLIFPYITTHIFLDEEHFLLTQSMGKALGESYIYIIEDETCEECHDAAFKLRFPVEVSWDELCSGGCVSDALFKVMHNCYYVFGDSGEWGKWCDYENSWCDRELFIYKNCHDEVRAYIEHFSNAHREYDELWNEIQARYRGPWGKIRRWFERSNF